MTGGGSVVVRRQLGIKLRRLRVAAGKSLADVQKSKLASASKINRMENGRLPVKIADVWALCRLYGADAATTDALAALAPGTEQDGWWEEYGEAVVPDWLGLYAGLEASASHIRGFEPEVVNGLLQTRDYAAAVMASDPRMDPQAVERRVDFRMDRQHAVFNAQPVPGITVVMGEGALRCGPRQVIKPQIEHLRALSAQPDVDIRVVPFSAGMFPRLGSFTLLDFDDEEDPSVAYVEVPKGARYLERPEDRADYEYVFEIILSRSTPIGDWKP